MQLNLANQCTCSPLIWFNLSFSGPVGLRLSLRTLITCTDGRCVSTENLDTTQPPYWFLYFECLVYIRLCRSVYISESPPAPRHSPTQFWCIARRDESQVTAKKKKKRLKKDICELWVQQNASLFYFYFCEQVFKDEF